MDMQSGSPPHVRERPVSASKVALPVGITPACAGKTHMDTISLTRARDHPRMCGKDPSQWAAQFILSGSPPHVRERHVLPTLAKVKLRITPACAGKTLSAPMQDKLIQDHPRMCGKDLFMKPLMLQPLGSPPHVRERL